MNIGRIQAGIQRRTTAICDAQAKQSLALHIRAQAQGGSMGIPQK